MTYYAVKIPEKYPDTPIKVYLYYQQEKTLSYEQFQALKRLCGSKYDLWQTVTVRLEGSDFIMLVEEEGKFKDFGINKLATMIYSNPLDVIVGDVWLLMFDGIEDLILLEEYQVGMIKADLLKRFGVPLGDFEFVDPDDGDASEELQRRKYYPHGSF